MSQISNKVLLALLLAIPFFACGEETDCIDLPCTQYLTIKFAPSLTERGAYQVAAVVDGGASIECSVTVTDTLKAGEGQCATEGAELVLSTPLGTGSVSVLDANTPATGIEGLIIRAASSAMHVSVRVVRDNVTVVNADSRAVMTSNERSPGCAPCFRASVEIPVPVAPND